MAEIKNTKIFVINASDWYNKGDVLNRIGLIYALRRAINPNINITFETTTYKEDKKYFARHNTKVIPSIFSYSKGDQLNRLIPKFLLSSIIIVYFAVFFKVFGVKPKKPKVEADYFNSIVESDIILSSPGGFIHDDLLLTVFIPSMLQISIPLLIKKPILIYAQSIGPLNKKISKLIVKFIFKKIDGILLREAISYTMLKELGINGIVTADAAFSIPTWLITNAQKQATILKSKREKMLVGFTILNQYWGSIEKRNSYIENMSILADWLIENFDAEIVFIPWRISSPDFLIAKEIYMKTKNKDSIKAPFNDQSPEELFAIVGSLDFLIGTRLHSCITAALMDTPFVNISYQFKSQGIMKQLGMEKYIISIDNFSAQKVIDILTQLAQNKQVIKKTLSEKVVEVRKKSQLNGEIVNLYLKKVKMQEMSSAKSPSMKGMN